MNIAEIEAKIEQMSEADRQALLATEFPEELEKQAEAELAENDLADAFYAYGAMTADLEIEACEAGEAGLSKEASAEFEAADQEISAAVEAGLIALGLDQIEDDVELHKQAMAAAAIIFEGYTDQIEKVAVKGGKEKGLVASVKGHVGAAATKASKAVKGFGKHVAKHPGKAGMLGAAGMAAGYGVGRLAHKKEASAVTVEELIDLTLQKQATLDIIADGIEKLAAHGGKKGKHLATVLKKVKGFGKHHGAHIGAAGAAGGAAGYLAGRMGKKK
jgi:hypothetical protein